MQIGREMTRDQILAGFADQLAMMQAECPDDVSTSVRNQEETLALGIAESDESRIRILGRLAKAGRIDPHNGLFIYDLAQHFDDPTMITQAQRVAQYHQTTGFLGRLERRAMRIAHPSIAPYVKL